MQHRYRLLHPRRLGFMAVAALSGWIVWLVLIGVSIEVPIPSEQIDARHRHSYLYEVPESEFWRVRSDDKLTPRQAESVLYENSEPIGPAHSGHGTIASIGMGHYSHWNDQLVLSSSDNSDPRSNGRRYSLICRGRLPPSFLLLPALTLVIFVASRARRWVPAKFPRQESAAPASPARFALRGLVWAGVTALGLAVTACTTHIAFWAGATLSLIGAIYLVANSTLMVLAMVGRESKLGLSHPLMFILLSVGVFAMLFEGTLGYLEASAKGRATKKRARASATAVSNGDHVPVPLLHPEAAAAKESRRGVLTLPEAWERRKVEIPGSTRSYLFHEVLHVHDQHSFRRTTPFPPRAEDTYRIMVVGDSITYGHGVDAKWIYSSLIEEELARDYRVEVLNLGVSGRQSQDILLILKKFLPELDPDLVLYGVCHNDFLPSGVGQYSRAYPFPMPESWKEFFLQRTRVAHFVDGAYDVLARASGLRADFYDDILRDFDGYQQRFARDVAAMNEVVQTHGLPAVVSLVFDQVPNTSRTSYQVTQSAERLLAAAGMTVIETEDYYRRFEGRNLMVSRWEGHPDEEAHAIFAAMFLEQIRSQADLRPYRRTQ